MTFIKDCCTAKSEGREGHDWNCHNAPASKCLRGEHERSYPEFMSKDMLDKLYVIPTCKHCRSLYVEKA